MFESFRGVIYPRRDVPETMQTYVMNEIRIEGIEQTRDEAKSAYAITFSFANNGAYCVRVHTSRRANSVVEIANWDRQYQSRIEREDVSGSKGRRANGK